MTIKGRYQDYSSYSKKYLKIQLVNYRSKQIITDNYRLKYWERRPPGLHNVFTPSRVMRFTDDIMNSNIKIKKDFFPSRYNVEYECTLDIYPKHLPVIVDSALKTILPKQVWQGGTILDLKGRDPQLLLDDSIPHKLKPKTEELAFIAGDVFLAEKEAFAAELDTSFSLTIRSAFDEFSGTHHISHSTHLLKTGELPDFVPLKDLGVLVPMHIKHFRLGLDLFSSHFLTSMIGFAPLVTQSLLLECHQDKVQLKLIAEKLKAKNTMPFSKDNQFEKLCDILSSVSDFDLFEDYRKQVL